MAEITIDEVEALEAVGRAFDKVSTLPVEHPKDLEELIRDIHDIQNRILARVGLRAMRERQGR